MSDGAQFAERAYAAVNARDREAMLALTTPDIVLATTVETHRGHQGVLGWLDAVDQVFEGYTLELVAAEEVAGHLVTSVRQRGRGRTSGIDVDHLFTHVWTLRDGLGAEMRAFTDRDDALRYATAREAGA